MRKCPRCELEKLNDEDVMNSKSHTFPGVIICNDCGEDENLTLLGILNDEESKIRQIKWENKKL